jgi:hypothetical protein
MDAERNAGPIVKQTRYLEGIDQLNGNRHWRIKSRSQQEACLGEWVGVHHYTADIANDLKDKAAKHSDKEPPYTVANTQDDLGDQT